VCTTKLPTFATAIQRADDVVTAAASSRVTGSARGMTGIHHDDVVLDTRHDRNQETRMHDDTSEKFSDAEESSNELDNALRVPRDQFPWYLLFAPKTEGQRLQSLERIAQAYRLLRKQTAGERRALLSNKAVAAVVSARVRTFNEFKAEATASATKATKGIGFNGRATAEASRRAKATAASKAFRPDAADATPAGHATPSPADAARRTHVLGQYRDFLRVSLNHDDLPSDAAKITPRMIGTLLAERQARNGQHPAPPARFPMMVAMLTIEHLIVQGFLPIDGEADASYDSEMRLAAGLMDFYASSTDTREQLKNEFAGHFYIYRKSWHCPGCYVKGALRVRPVKISDEIGRDKGYALCTTERHIHHGQDGSAPVQETYVGVMSRKQGHAFILSSLSSPDRKKRGAPRYTLLHTTVHESLMTETGAWVSRVGSMSGTTVAMAEARQGYSAAVCIERAPGTAQPPTEALGVFEPNEVDREGRLRIPRSVIARLG
jgi:hypothetical protein